MTTDLKALELRIDTAQEDADESLEELMATYCETIVEEFRNSPEATELASPTERIGRWASHFVYEGYSRIGVGLSQMTPADLWEVLGEIFPRQVTIFDPADPDEIIREIRVFLLFLKRGHQLQRADLLLEILDQIEPDFSRHMFDPTKFGPAKSFIMAGRQAGYDMSDPAQLNQFMLEHNLSRAASLQPLPSLDEPLSPLRSGRPKHETARRNNKRKQQRAGRKASRKRK